MEAPQSPTSLLSGVSPRNTLLFGHFFGLASHAITLAPSIGWVWATGSAGVMLLLAALVVTVRNLFRGSVWDLFGKHKPEAFTFWVEAVLNTGIPAVLIAAATHMASTTGYASVHVAVEYVYVTPSLLFALAARFMVTAPTTRL